MEAWGKRISARVPSPCRGPEVGTYLECSMNCKVASVAESGWRGGKEGGEVVGDELRASKG